MLGVLCCAGVLTSCGNVIDEDAPTLLPRTSTTESKPLTEISEEDPAPQSVSEPEDHSAADSSEDDPEDLGAEQETAENPVSEEPVQAEPVPEQTMPVPEQTMPVTTVSTTVAAVTEIPKPAPDTTPPYVRGSDVNVYCGGTISYRKYITVRDDSGMECSVEINSSAVDLDTIGRYPVEFVASDPSGNKAAGKYYVNVIQRPADPAKDLDGYIHQQASALLAKITTANMNQMQKAYAIYYWVKHNIYYTEKSDKSDWRLGAKQGFQTHTGDCFVSFAVSKALLMEAGIQNADVVKLRADDKDARHYWSFINVGTGWYHFDSTAYRVGHDYFFMLTDAELKAWDDKYYKGCHNYSHDGLPELSAVSVQGQINYSYSRLN